tara:strand:- start:298 stop:426 length:129 start_codon:yes stop_codon:yes gene_type:complete
MDIIPFCVKQVKAVKKKPLFQTLGGAFGGVEETGGIICFYPR